MLRWCASRPARVAVRVLHVHAHGAVGTAVVSATVATADASTVATAVDKSEHGRGRDEDGRAAAAGRVRPVDTTGAGGHTTMTKVTWSTAPETVLDAVNHKHNILTFPFVAVAMSKKCLWGMILLFFFLFCFQPIILFFFFCHRMLTCFLKFAFYAAFRSAMYFFLINTFGDTPPPPPLIYRFLLYRWGIVNTRSRYFWESNTLRWQVGITV